MTGIVRTLDFHQASSDLDQAILGTTQLISMQHSAKKGKEKRKNEAMVKRKAPHHKLSQLRLYAKCSGFHNTRTFPLFSFLKKKRGFPGHYMISRHEKYIQVDGFCDNVLCPLIGKSSRLLFQVIVVQRFNIQSDKAKK